MLYPRSSKNASGTRDHAHGRIRGSDDPWRQRLNKQRLSESRLWSQASFRLQISSFFRSRFFVQITKKEGCHMSYRNSEGYSDPTAGKALARIMREERIKTQKRTVNKGVISYDITRVSPADHNYTIRTKPCTYWRRYPNEAIFGASMLKKF